MKTKSFPPEVIARLKAYVYRLIDPRNGETFYVGKGTGNRVFAHIQDARSIDQDDHRTKFSRIRDIQDSGFEVSHVIHRHGMSDATAIEVEAALIDAYPGLANDVGGAGSGEFGARHAQEIMQEHAAKSAKFQHNAVLISVNRSASERGSLLEAAQYAWKINPAKASSHKLAMAVMHGIIKAVFEVENWVPATTENFPGLPNVPGRYGFKGHPAPQAIRTLYVGKRVPDEYRKRGSSNPIRYVTVK
ncbi:MAG: hypothetical protein IBJ11_08935 [Phycisphaerales bacterium]|nr:hypothetical protein [Phycisphaerales bacterium]